MAEQPQLVRSKTMESLPKKCEVCQGSFKDPKVLPCFHILCRECVRALQVRGRDEIKCPINRCSKKFSCPEMDPESLTDASVVYHFQDLNKFKRRLEKEELICTSCYTQQAHKEVKAVASCDQCEYVCKGCKKRHDKEDQFSDHVVTSFHELSQQQDDAKHLDVLRRSRANTFVQQTRNKCSLHTGNRCNSYCMDCRKYVCADCINESHLDHHYRVASIAYEECSQALRDFTPSIALTKNRAVNTVESIKQRKTAIQDQRLSLSSTIDSTFERLTKIMERRKRDLKSKLNHLTERKLNNLSVQQLELEKTAEEMARMMDFVENVLSSSTERELLKIYSFLHERSRASVECLKEENLHPVEEANTALKSSAVRHMSELCRRDLEIYSREASAGACSVEEGEGLRSAQTLHYSQFALNVVDRHLRPCPSVQDVSVRIKCSENDFESPAEVRDRGTGRYLVSYCPEFRGRHQIYISVNDHPITGSPFSLDVHMPRSQLGVSQGCIVDVTQPRGIVLTPTGNIMICEWNGQRIIEMDRLGRRVRALGSHGVVHPASLALDGRGDIFVVEGVGPKAGVVKWDRIGRLVNAVWGEGEEVGQFRCPRGVKIGPTQREVFVCDRDNSRIQVFDTDLNFLRCIDFHVQDSARAQRPKPNDLAFDRAGNMYVTDFANNCIHQFGPDERYWTSFSRTLPAAGESTRRELAGPECLFVDDACYLYVTESQAHQVSVFHLPSRECVRVFGGVGKGEGELNFPMGVAVDEVGHVYVCELHNNRIQVF